VKDDGSKAIRIATKGALASITNIRVSFKSGSIATSVGYRSRNGFNDTVDVAVCEAIVNKHDSVATLTGSREGIVKRKNVSRLGDAKIRIGIGQSLSNAQVNRGENRQEDGTVEGRCKVSLKDDSQRFIRQSPGLAIKVHDDDGDAWPAFTSRSWGV
jgi:hypothetical protein